jgi:hypothetical protein
MTPQQQQESKQHRDVGNSKDPSSNGNSSLIKEQEKAQPQQQKRQQQQDQCGKAVNACRDLATLHRMIWHTGREEKERRVAHERGEGGWARSRIIHEALVQSGILTSLLFFINAGNNKKKIKYCGGENC